MPVPATVLCLNSGSSSLKLALFRTTDVRAHGDEQPLLRGGVEGIARERGRLWLRDADGNQTVSRAVAVPDQATAAQALFSALPKEMSQRITAVGHRIVHGGPAHVEPTRVDEGLIAALRAAVPFAPLHLPAELATLEAAREAFAGVPHVVCFDTAFHRAMPAVAQRLPLPRALSDRGVRRYGFHGLSYEFIVAALGNASVGKLVIAHLGSGASMAAVRDGVSVDTTMGLTPTGGLMMATRSGDLDPGVLLHLLRAEGHDADSLADMLEQRSGLRGISGTSADMQVLLETRGHDAAAAEAVDSFCYAAQRHLGALSAVLGGLDTLVFTGGIGQHAAAVRAEICASLAYLGVVLDDAANAAHAPIISRPDAACRVRVMATDEERMIARHTATLLAI